MVICPNAFQDYDRSLIDIKCEDLPQAADLTIQTLGSVMLHEFTHWHVLAAKVGLYSIADYGYNGFQKMQVVGQPEHGYGPLNSQLVKRNGKVPFLNADNYAWFATEAYFARRCPGHTFVDATVPGPNDPANPPQPDAVQNLGPGPAP
jgi:hypothetical protein